MEVLRFHVKSAGQEEVVKTLDATIAERSKEIARVKIRSMEEVAEYNFKQGIITGLELARSLPQALLEDAEREFKEELINERIGESERDPTAP